LLRESGKTSFYDAINFVTVQMKKAAPFTIGYSTCPNDTLIFCPLVKGLVGCSIPLAPEELADVETLNTWALVGRLDITKLSFSAFGHVMDRYVMLSSGAALGRGCGPLVVSREKMPLVNLSGARVAIPGRLTTAAMLFRMRFPECADVVAISFDQIMPAIVRGEVDAGVLIHESRFTYQRHGLHMLLDLGEWWEQTAGAPIPLGGIAMKRSLGEEVAGRFEKELAQSVRWALAHRDKCSDYVSSHAQEMDEHVLQSHISLYVTPFTVDLGKEGKRAVELFLRQGREAGCLPPSTAAPFLTVDN